MNTSVELVEWNRYTIKYIAALENLEDAHYWAYKSGIDSGRYKNINPLDTIPMEDITNPRISLRTIRKKYNPSKDAYRFIIKYRRENNIQHQSRYNPISVIPLEELNNADISTNWLHKKYAVSQHKINDYRNKVGIKHVLNNINGVYQSGCPKINAPQYQVLTK